MSFAGFDSLGCNLHNCPLVVLLPLDETRRWEEDEIR